MTRSRRTVPAMLRNIARHNEFVNRNSAHAVETATTSSVSDAATLRPWRALLVRTGHLHAAVAVCILIPVVLWLVGEPFPLLWAGWVRLAWIGLFFVMMVDDLSLPVRYAAFAVFVLTAAALLVPELRSAMESDPQNVVAVTLWTTLLGAGVTAAALATVGLAVNWTVGAVRVGLIAVGVSLTGLAGVVACLVFGFGSSVLLAGLWVVFVVAVILILTVLEGLVRTGSPWRVGLLMFVFAETTFSGLLQLLSTSAGLTG